MEPIQTKRLILKELSTDDANDMYLYAKEPTVGYNAGWPPHKSIEETKEILALMINKKEVYGIFLQNKLIGTIDITFINKAYYLGYALGRDYWGQGIMSEAAAALLQKFFSENQTEKVYANTFNTNIRSQALLKKLGFSFVKDIKIEAFGQMNDSYLFELDYNKFKEVSL